MRLLAVALAAVVSVGTFAGDCTPPPNEVCDGATIFTGAELPYEVTAPLGCFNDMVDRPYFDVFYRFDCTRTGTYLVHMCGSSGDAYLRVYGDGCGWGDGFELAVADDECPGSPPNADPLLLVNLEAGQRYWFELGTFRPDPPWAPPLNSPYFFRVAFEEDPPGAAGRLDVDAGPEQQLQIAKDDPELVLSWGDSCIADDTDYAVYQGDLGELGVHMPISCTTNGLTELTAAVPLGNAYFLVTAHNDFVNGSYGFTTAGGQRSQGKPACYPRFAAQCP